MQNIDKISLNSESILSDSLAGNKRLLLLLERFGIGFGMGDGSIAEVCKAQGVVCEVFLSISNSYLGSHYTGNIPVTSEAIACLIRYLQSSHSFYLDEKYPELRGFIAQMKELNRARSMAMVERFFNEYFDEVAEHLNYENDVVFPYILKLLNDESLSGTDFSVDEYKDHHNDIEDKLNDLKNLLIKYMPVDGDGIPRRKLLNSLFELEFDLNIHSMVEDTILIPLVRKMEKSRRSTQ
jgi:regulator of cell morphogenesis and NO signaling